MKRNGHFPDADMLPLGRIGIRVDRGDNRMCALSKDEQTTMMSLFAIFRSPLMFGGDLPGNDELTLSLLTNKEVIYVNQFSQNNKQLFSKDDLIAWVADDPKTGDKFLAVFNAQDQIKTDESKVGIKIPVDLELIGTTGNCTIKDVWSNQSLGSFSKGICPFHQTSCFRTIPNFGIEISFNQELKGFINLSACNTKIDRC